MAVSRHYKPGTLPTPATSMPSTPLSEFDPVRTKLNSLILLKFKY